MSFNPGDRVVIMTNPTNTSPGHLFEATVIGFSAERKAVNLLVDEVSQSYSGNGNSQSIKTKAEQWFPAVWILDKV